MRDTVNERKMNDRWINCFGGLLLLLLLPALVSGAQCDFKLRCCSSYAVSPDVPPEQASIIQPLLGWRLRVAVIVDWGNCTASNCGFMGAIFWGDGTSPHVEARNGTILQMHQIHSYPRANKGYLMTVRYCWVGENQVWPPPPNACCSDYSQVVMISYDPFSLIF